MGKNSVFSKVLKKFNPDLEPEEAKQAIENIITTLRIKTIHDWVITDSSSYTYARKQSWYEEIVKKYKLRPSFSEAC